MANNTYNRFTNTNINIKEDYSMEIRFVNTQQTNCFGVMLPGGGFFGGEQTDVLPGGGFFGGEQTDVLPGGGFHTSGEQLPGGGFFGGEQTDVLPGGGFHTSGEQPPSEHLEDDDLHEDEVSDDKLPCQGTFGVDWFFV